jgi:hypothetical protein
LHRLFDAAEWHASAAGNVSERSFFGIHCGARRQAFEENAPKFRIAK